MQTFDGEGRDSTRVDRLTTVVDTINNDLLFHDARDHIIKVRTPFDTTAFRYTPLGSVAVTAEQNQDGGHENQQFNTDGLGNMFQELTDFFQFGSLYTYRYEPHTGRLRATLAPNVSGILFDTSTYDPAGNRNWQFKYDLMDGWSAMAPWAQELSFNYYAADNTLRLVDRDECYLQTPNQGQCTQNPAGNFAGAYEEYRYDALGRRILVRTRRDQWCFNTTGCYSTMTRNVWDGDQVLFEVRVPAWTTVSADTLEADTTFIGGPGSAYGPYGRVLYTHGLGLDEPLGVVRLGYSFGDSATNWNGPQDLVLYRNWRGIPNAGTWTDGTTSLHCSNLHPSLCVLIRYPATSTTTYFVSATSQPDSGWFGTITTQDPDGSGELYKRNRYYDPTQGRFTQEDPIGLAGGLNIYGFAGGDPVDYSAPFGLLCCFSPRDFQQIVNNVARSTEFLVKLEPAMLVVANLPTVGVGDAALSPEVADLGKVLQSGAGSGILTSAGVATRVAETTGGTIEQMSKSEGFKVRVMDGKAEILARIKATGDVRVSISGKGGLTGAGELSSDKALTHFKDLSSDQITALIDRARELVRAMRH